MKNKILNFIYFLTHSNLYLSFGTLLSGFSTYLILSLPVDFKVLLILFLGVFSFYLMNRYWELKEDELTYPERTKFLKRRKKLLLFLIIFCYLTTLILAYLKSLNAVFGVFFVTMLIVSYTIRIKGIRLKDFFVIKNLTISFAWGFIFTFFHISEILNFNLAFFLTFFFLGAFTFINTVIFDMRDVKGDEENKIQTIPVRLGLEKSRKIIFALNSLLLFSLILIWFYNLIPYSFILFLTSLYLYLPIYLSKKEDLHFVADVLGDGWIIFYGCLGLILWLI